MSSCVRSLGISLASVTGAHLSSSPRNSSHAPWLQSRLRLKVTEAIKSQGRAGESLERAVAHATANTGGPARRWQNPRMAAFPRPPGLISALAGGVLGAVVGVWVSMLLFEQLKAGDLSDIATEIFLLLGGLLVGPSAGVATALAIRKHDRALATGLVAGPLVTMAMIGGFNMFGRLPLSDDVAGLIGLPLLVAVGIAAIWMARWFTAR